MRSSAIHTYTARSKRIRRMVINGGKSIWNEKAIGHLNRTVIFLKSCIYQRELLRPKERSIRPAFFRQLQINTASSQIIKEALFLNSSNLPVFFGTDLTHGGYCYGVVSAFNIVFTYKAVSGTSNCNTPTAREYGCYFLAA